MPDKFRVEFASRAQKDLSKLSQSIRNILLKRATILQQDPFPQGSLKKKIKGVKYPLFRLRVNTPQDSFRLFYGIQKEVVLILRIVSKKDADKVLRVLRN